MKESKSMSSVSLGVCDVIGIVFLILKLIGVINWSWLWVLSPFWIPIGLLVVIGILLKLLD